MTKRRLWPATWVAAITVVGSVGAAGCQGSASQSAPIGAMTPPLENCPPSLDKTIGAACSMNGLVCGPSIACGLTELTISCVCTGGVFRCLDAQGNPLASAAAVTCPDGSEVVDAGACPRSEKAASLAACSETGLLCAYPSACPGSLDQCQCFPGTMASGGFGLRFECRPASCPNPDAAVIHFDAAGEPPPAADSGGGSEDATAGGRPPDAGSPKDGGDADSGDAGIVADGSPPVVDGGADGGDQ